MSEGYCVKCKKKVEISNEVVSEVTGSRGTRRIEKGNCPECNTKVCVILKKNG